MTYFPLDARKLLLTAAVRTPLPILRTTGHSRAPAMTISAGHSRLRTGVGPHSSRGHHRKMAKPRPTPVGVLRADGEATPAALPTTTPRVLRQPPNNRRLHSLLGNSSRKTGSRSSRTCPGICRRAAALSNRPQPASANAAPANTLGPPSRHDLCPSRLVWRRRTRRPRRPSTETSRRHQHQHQHQNQHQHQHQHQHQRPR